MNEGQGSIQLLLNIWIITLRSTLEIFKNIHLFILGCRGSLLLPGFFYSCCELGLLVIAVCRFRIAVAMSAECRAQPLGMRASVAAAPQL